jgi:hypothetical protein
LAADCVFAHREDEVINTEHDVRTGPTPDRDICRMRDRELLAVIEYSGAAFMLPGGLNERQQAFRDACWTEALSRMRRGGEATL